MALPYANAIVCPVLVGREPHLESLARLMHEARGSSGHLVLVSGEAGVGKSRLLAELRRQADRQGFLGLQGHCFEHDAAFPYAPFIDLLRGSLTPKQLSEKLLSLGSWGGEIVKLLPELATSELQPTAALERRMRPYSWQIHRPLGLVRADARRCPDRVAGRHQPNHPLRSAMSTLASWLGAP